MYTSHNDVIIATSNILCKINYQNSHHLSFPPQAIVATWNYWLTIASSTVISKICFTVILCIYVCTKYIQIFKVCIILKMSQIQHFHDYIFKDHQLLENLQILWDISYQACYFNWSRSQALFTNMSVRSSSGWLSLYITSSDIWSINPYLICIQDTFLYQRL